ncbi:ATP-dependent DNA helicase DinG [Cellvibrio japonicus]|uniref:ATP-dependent DNA helicase DinG n=1 Tax=Cellvibrio japonicus (strain Ueda107) TaxID=498211 RepID=B3PKE9_CELJU|nr:ATP-dependent DNA helicase DinG [Cellvibrio japonicus]ACE83333.1 ATP-dependent helicase, DinG family [Cellvibrio japonicus Ueda107]QEI12818.1 ATP-dependent DNA helicase DinG [Cellvibrio japonicus]QEI16392.1 ATP-dependent DNA helicase DinG [Cellvibrio japonicus]QEI19970.1 ATP-dependent DNA helicase DinG [Cellvibrio japonicus]
MLTEAVKKQIQAAYSQFLDSKGLKPRYGQKLMIAEIAKSLGTIELDEDNQRVPSAQAGAHICVVEAGTGTGKTIAYLLPALVIAKYLGKKLVVSTATVALQEQIVNKDLPELMRHSGLSFSFTLAKGRSRYLCLSKLDNVIAEYESGINPTRALYEDEYPSVSAQSIKLYQSMVEALAGNKWNGERDTWPQALEQDAWQVITTDHRQCTGRRCSNVSVCSFFRARDSLHAVDCIVTNHDLVLADLALGGGAILPAPEEAIFVFDEGHHLPQKALNHFAHHSRMLATSKWLDQCNKSLGTMLGHISGAGNVDRYAEQLPAQFMETKQYLDRLYPRFEQLAQRIALEERQSHYRFPQGIVPDDLQLDCVEIYKSVERLAELLNKMSNELSEAMEDPHCPVPKVDLENHYPVVATWLARAEANRDLWFTFATPDSPGSVPRARWLTPVDQNGSLDLEVCSSPILAAKTLEYSLWEKVCGAVVTSATLTALGNFQRFQMRAGTPAGASYHQVPSPFNFQQATLEIPAATIEATHAEQHTQAIIAELPQLVDVDEGSLVLFSSRKQMLDVYDAVPASLRERILIQGDSSKQEMLQQHKAKLDGGEGSILFGLASFAEGVDLPGRYCTHVIIAKLPFAVPDDPIEAALSEWVESRGGNAFMEITVPDASLKLIQACGRLLRTETDTGRISLLDRRIITKRYGKAILNSLPPFTQVIHK